MADYGLRKLPKIRSILDSFIYDENFCENIKLERFERRNICSMDITWVITSTWILCIYRNVKF